MPATLASVRTRLRALPGHAVWPGRALWGAVALALASACGGHVGGGDADGGSRGDSIAPISTSGSSTGALPPGATGSIGSSWSGTAPPSSGPSTGSAPPSSGSSTGAAPPGTRVPEDASSAGLTMPSPAPGTNCVPSPASASNGSGQCQSILVNDCNGTHYQVICTCPRQQCACFGPTSKVIPFGGCPYCPSFGPGPQAPGGPSISDLFAACGYPH
jgi:hypothetical protein